MGADLGQGFSAGTKKLLGITASPVLSLKSRYTSSRCNCMYFLLFQTKPMDFKASRSAAVKDLRSLERILLTCLPSLNPTNSGGHGGWLSGTLNLCYSSYYHFNYRYIPFVFI